MSWRYCRRSVGARTNFDAARLAQHSRDPPAYGGGGGFRFVTGGGRRGDFPRHDADGDVAGRAPVVGAALRVVRGDGSAAVAGTRAARAREMAGVETRGSPSHGAGGGGPAAGGGCGVFAAPGGGG